MKNRATIFSLLSLGFMLLMALIILLCVSDTPTTTTVVSAVCNDGTNAMRNFTSANMTKAQQDEMAARLEATLCTDRGGVFLLNPRQHEF